MILLEMKIPQLSKPEATAARNENSIGDRMEKKPWDKPGSVGEASSPPARRTSSLFTPCYDVERLETKTQVGLGPGESIEYTKHRVSLEGHPWPGCHSEETWHPYSYGQTKL